MSNRSCVAFVLLSLVTATTAFAQTSTPVTQPWSGWARCQLTIQGPGYAHSETQLWTITGAGIQRANMEIYPTKWTVTGLGSLARDTPPTRVSAQWSGSGTLTNVEIGFTRHLDRITFQRWTGHGPAREAFLGAETRTVNGSGITRALRLDVQQWTFPAGQTGLTSTRISGSNSMPFNGARGPMGPTGTNGTATCSWDFARGSESPSSPPPASLGNPPASEPVSGGAASGSAGNTGGTGTGGVVTGRAPAGGGAPAGGTTTGSGGNVTADVAVTVTGSIPSDPTGQPVAAFVAGETVLFSAEVRNSGPGTVDGAVLTVPAAAGLSPDLSTIRHALGRFTPGTTGRVSWNANVTGPVGSSVSLTATVVLPAGVTDSNPGNNSHTLTRTIAPAGGGSDAAAGSADLSAVVSVRAIPPVTSWPANGTANYQLDIRNNGPANADGAVLRVPVSPGLPRWRAVSCIADGGAVCAPPGGFITAYLENGHTIHSLPAGGHVQVMFSSDVAAAAGSSVSVAATVAAPPRLNDPNPANNSSTTTQTIVAAASGTSSGTSSGGTPQGPAIVSLSPNSIEQGVSLSGAMTLTGQGTNWQQGATSVDFGPGIIIQTLQVQSPTSLRVLVMSTYAAAAGPRAVTVTTGAQSVTLVNGLTVTPRAQPVISQISPNSAAAGQQNVSVTITGQNTRWAQGITDVSLRGPQGLAGPRSLIVNSPTSITVTFDFDATAPAGPRDVVVMNTGAVVGSDVITVEGGFAVTSGGITPSAGTVPVGLVYTGLGFGCVMRGPDLGHPVSNPTYTEFSWPALGGVTGYTIARRDVGTVATLPGTPASGSSAYVRWEDRGWFDFRQTYAYTVVAQYGQTGCGVSVVSVSPRRPDTPSVSPITGQVPGRVTLSWSMPGPSKFQRVTGVLVQGPYLPQAGRALSGEIGRTDIDGVPAGTHTWTVTAYWDIPSLGRKMEPETAARVTVNVP